MRQLKYVNSKGDVIDFRSFDTRIFSGQFHAYSWEHDSVPQRMGVVVNGYKKNPLELEMSVAVMGSKQVCESALNRITEITESDVLENKSGRLWWGDYYLECNIVAASTVPSENFSGAERTFGIFAPYPFWTKEVNKRFFPQTAPEGTNGLNYPHDYPYNFSRGASGAIKWNTGHFAPSNFEMIIYGPCINPRVNIDDHIYQVYDDVEDDEFIVINSRNNIVIKHYSNGTSQSIWNKQNKESSIFMQIPGSVVTVTWSGLFGFDITLFEERSEPAW